MPLTHHDLGPDHDRRAVLRRLRGLLPAAELGPEGEVVALGSDAIEACLPRGGLARGALHEVAPATMADAAAALGFVAALLCRVLASDEGRLLVVLARGGGFDAVHGHGLAGLGLPPDRLLIVEAGGDVQALWAIEEGLRSGAVRAVAGCLAGPLPLKPSRRLNLAAGASGTIPIVLRPPDADRPNAAATRWRVAAAAAARDRFGCFARWRWRVALERCRNGRLGAWLVEWDHAAHRFGVVGALADHALPDGAEAGSGRRAG